MTTVAKGSFLAKRWQKDRGAYPETEESYLMAAEE